MGQRVDIRLSPLGDRLEPLEPPVGAAVAAEQLVEASHEDFPGKECAHEPLDIDRKEVWTVHDTAALVDVYEEASALKGRGAFRQKDWRKLSELLSSQAGIAKSPEQCRSRVDYLKKFYRKERQKYGGTSVESPWFFYKKMELIAGEAWKQQDVSKQAGIPGGIDGGELQKGIVDKIGTVRVASSPEEMLKSPNIQQPSATNTVEQEEETVATPKRQADVASGTCFKPGKKRWKLMGSKGKDLKEGLSEFDAVMERIEKTKTELTLALERQRAEQEEKRAQMDMECMKMIMQNQQEVARLFYGTR